MSWKDKMQEWGGGDISFLSEDGECIAFCVVGDPVLIKGKFRNNDTERIACPIVTVDGFTLLVIGKRVARRLAKHEADFKKYAFEIIRHGESGDTKTKYELKRCDIPELEKELLALKKKGVTQEVIDEAVQAAEEVAEG